jgi:hypothetical protein
MLQSFILLPETFFLKVADLRDSIICLKHLYLLNKTSHTYGKNQFKGTQLVIIPVINSVASNFSDLQQSLSFSTEMQHIPFNPVKISIFLL